MTQERVLRAIRSRPRRRCSAKPDGEDLVFWGAGQDDGIEDGDAPALAGARAEAEKRADLAGDAEGDHGVDRDGDQHDREREPLKALA